MAQTVEAALIPPRQKRW